MSKSLTLVLSLLAWLPLAAQADDVTAQYISNADFESGEAVTQVIYTYNYNMGADSQDELFGLQEVPHWTANTPTTNTYIDGSSTTSADGKAGALFSYGNETAGLGGDYYAPTTGPDAETDGQCLGIVAVWSQVAYYASDTLTLPPGSYTLSVSVYNSSGTASLSTNHIGFVETGGATHLATATSYTVGEWTTESIAFVLTQETTGNLRLGYAAASNGSSTAPHLFFDNVTLYYQDLPDDRTAYILSNAGFEQCTPISEDITSSTAHTIDYASVEWTSGTTDDWAFAGAVAYGSNRQVNGATVPETSWDANSANLNAMGFSLGWGNSFYYASPTLTLPAGDYVITAHTYNANASATNWASNLTGFVTADATYYLDATAFTYGQWETQAVAFTLDAPTEGYISVGGTGVSGSGSNSNAKVYFDDIAILTTATACLGTPTITLPFDTASLTLGTLTVDYQGAWNIDATATLVLADSATATLTGSDGQNLSFTLQSTDNGFCADLSSVLLARGCDYTISVPAGIYGFSDGSALNQAITQTVLTTAVDDGYYYLRTTLDDEYCYLSRGDTWGTRATTDPYGLPFLLNSTPDDGLSTIYFPDIEGYLYETTAQNIYTDGSSNTSWRIVGVDSGYAIRSANGLDADGYYILLDSDGLPQFSASSYTTWLFEPLSQHRDIVEQLKDQQAADAAAQAGIEGISSRDELEALLATYASQSISLATTQDDATESYQASASGSSSGMTVKSLASESVTLSEGLYKYSVQAFHRYASNATTEDLCAPRGLVFLNAGDVSTQLLSPFDYAATTPWDDDDYAGTGDYAGYYFPNNQSGAAAAFDAGAYANDVYFYIDEEQDVSLSLTNNQVYASVSQWTAWQGFSLTRYAPDVSVTISTLQYATFYYSAFNLAVPDGLTAYTAVVDSEQVVLTPVPDNIIPAATGVVLGVDAADLTAATTYQLSIVYDDVDPIDDNQLIGSDTQTTFADEGYTYYVLSQRDGVTAFYWPNTQSGSSVTNSAHKASLAVPGDLDAFSLPIAFAVPTAINAVTTADDAAPQAIYTLTGLRLQTDPQALSPGIYLINGRKVLIR